jgi:hypothetical protein
VCAILSLIRPPKLLLRSDTQARCRRETVSVFWSGSRLFSLLAVLPMLSGVSGAAEIVSDRYRIDMPVQSVNAGTVFEGATPWGKARSTTFHGTNEDEATIYHFVSFDFVSARPIKPGKLKQSIAYFLHSRKCTATELKQPPALDAEGNAWPQVLWEGRCASGESYRNLQFIAHGRLYEIGITHPLALSKPTPDLDRALSTFADRCRFTLPSSADGER